MMRDFKVLDKFPQVIKEMREVVEKGGFGTSVTPVSQFYFQQAYNNVMAGKWKQIAEGYGKMVLGYFGRTPVEPDPEVVKLAEEQLKLPRTTESPLVLAERDEKKSIAYWKEQLEKENIELTEENIFIAVSCQTKGIAFLKGDGKVNVRKISEEKKKEEAKAAQTNGSSNGNSTPKQDYIPGNIQISNTPPGFLGAPNTNPTSAVTNYKITVEGQSFNVQVQSLN